MILLTGLGIDGDVRLDHRLEDTLCLISRLDVMSHVSRVMSLFTWFRDYGDVRLDPRLEDRLR